MSKQTTRRQFVAFAAGIFVLSAAGCGGSKSNDTPDPTASVITRATESSLSSDAKILATREATGPYVSLDAARAFDADLSKIRAAYPGVSDIRARLPFTPKRLLVIVKPAAPWIAKWDASSDAGAAVTDTDLTTGERTLDAILLKYDATRTRSASSGQSGRFYVLQFAAALNMPAVAEELSQNTANFASVEVDALAGDGDNIVFRLGSGGTKVYEISQGYGDCPAGCINRYTRTYTLAPNGGLSETVTGTPPPLIVGAGL